MTEIRLLLEDPKGIKTGWAGKWAELTWTCPSSLSLLSPPCRADLVQSHYSLGKPTETGWVELQTLTVPSNVVWHNWSLNTQEQISIRSIPKTDCILKCLHTVCIITPAEEQIIGVPQLDSRSLKMSAVQLLLILLLLLKLSVLNLKKVPG